MQIEAEALKKEDDKASKDRLAKLEEELAELQEKSDAMTTKWQAERDKLEGARELKEQLDRARAELDAGQARGQPRAAGELSYGDHPGAREEARRGREPATTT